MDRSVGLLAPTLVGGTVVWTLVAVAGARTWTLVPALAALLWAALIVSPRIAGRSWRWLDLALAGAVAAVAFQMVPLPFAWRGVLSPHAALVEGAIRLGGVDSSLPRPISLNPSATARALLVDLLTLGVFWTCRDIAARGALRYVVRAIGAGSLVIAIVAVVVAGTTPAASSHLVYGIFQPTDPAARPYGPFLNRNHMGTWILLSLPLLVGYMARRAQRLSRSGAPMLDATMLWFGGSAVAMFLALIVSMSRSAMVGAFAAGTVGVVLAAAKGGASGRRAAFAACGLVAGGLVLALSIPRTSELLGRFDRAFAGDATGGRLEIWRETLPMIRDFSLTGVGAGAYPTGMLVYQESSRQFFFNQAHNQYLQIVAEGGLLVTVPLALAATAFGLALVRRLRSDRSATYWIRVGATAGIAGALVQGLWDIGLATAANALLFAAVCAIAVYDAHYETHY